MQCDGGSCAGGIATRTCRSGIGRPCCRHGCRACPININPLAPNPNVEITSLQANQFCAREGRAVPLCVCLLSGSLSRLHVPSSLTQTPCAAQPSPALDNAIDGPKLAGKSRTLPG